MRNNPLPDLPVNALESLAENLENQEYADCPCCGRPHLLCPNYRPEPFWRNASRFTFRPVTSRRVSVGIGQPLSATSAR